MPPRRDEGPPMSAREARGLRYESETPKFLQQLHAQVHGTRFEAERSRPPSKADETDPVLSWLDPTGAATSSSSRASQSGGNTVDAYDSDNDLDYAQIVVLKEGKHLTEEQYQQTKQAAAHSPTSMQDNASNKTQHDDVHASHAGHLPQAIVGPHNNKSSMMQAKKLIRTKRAEIAQNSHKPKKARKQRQRLGAGLSFDLDESG